MHGSTHWNTIGRQKRMGTTGTLMGLSRRFRELKPDVELVGVEPYLGHKIQGLKNMKESYRPGIFEKSLTDRIINIDDEEAYHILKKMSYDGRTSNMPWGEQDIDTMGYHYYMTPENADIGLTKFQSAKDYVPKSWSYKDYPFLPNMKVFK